MERAAAPVATPATAAARAAAPTVILTAGSWKSKSPYIAVPWTVASVSNLGPLAASLFKRGWYHLA